MRFENVNQFKKIVELQFMHMRFFYVHIKNVFTTLRAYISGTLKKKMAWHSELHYLC